MDILKSKGVTYLHYWVFQGLFIIGYMFHQTEEWDSRPLALFSLACLLLFILIPKISDAMFLVLLIVCAYINLDKFPNLANHSNITLFITLLLLPYQTLLVFKPKEIHLSSLFTTLRVIVFIIYFFAVFHKLNWDFINPEVSCANRKLEDYFFLIPNSMAYLETSLQKIMPIVGLLVEGAVPVLVFFRKTRGLGLLALVILHFTLAPMGFTDFSSFAMCLAWCFLDKEKMNKLSLQRDFKILGLTAFLIAAGFGLTRYSEQIETYEFTEGVLFAIIYTPFLYLHFWRRHWAGSMSLPKRVPQLIFVTLFFLFGFSNYLGLRTAGTFSMFSNLVTEGEKSNHMILGSNPFKFFGFQEDLVEILDVHPNIVGFYRKMPQVGQRIPRVEFSRIIRKFRRYHWDRVNMRIRYNGEIIQTFSAGFDPNFDLETPYWQRKLFKFRHVQEQGPQECWW